MARRSIPQLNAKQVKRFWKKVKIQPSGCWEWQASTDGVRYGTFGIGTGTSYRAHRVAYSIYYLTDPAELCVCHTCDNGLCVNPLHLWLGTNADNNLDKLNKGRDNSPKGERQAHSKLKEKDIAIIRQRRANGETVEALGREYGVHHSAISFACTRRTWKHVL